MTPFAFEELIEELRPLGRVYDLQDRRLGEIIIEKAA